MKNHPASVRAQGFGEDGDAADSKEAGQSPSFAFAMNGTSKAEAIIQPRQSEHSMATEKAQRDFERVQASDSASPYSA